METNSSPYSYQDDSPTSAQIPMITAMFHDRKSTEQAYSDLQERGYTSDEINVIMSEDTRKNSFGNEDGHPELTSKAAEGAGTGTAIGGTIGALIGIIGAIGTSILIPGLGILVAGPIAAGLMGAGAGGITGGIIGATIGSAIPEEKAKLYESGIKEGGVLIGVHPHNEDDARFLNEKWKQHLGDYNHH